jgi:hypothetical protein
MNRPISNVLMEALVIGVMNAVLIFGIKQMNFKIESSLLHFIAGALIHLIFEYTGGNSWWCKKTYQTTSIKL